MYMQGCLFIFIPMLRQCHNVFDTNDFIDLIVDCIPQKFAIASEVMFNDTVLQSPASAFHMHSYPCAFSCAIILFLPYIAQSLLSGKSPKRECPHNPTGDRDLSGRSVGTFALLLLLELVEFLHIVFHPFSPCS